MRCKIDACDHKIGVIEFLFCGGLCEECDTMIRHYEDGRSSFDPRKEKCIHSWIIGKKHKTVCGKCGKQ